MNPSYPAVAERAEWRCEYCHAPEKVFNFAFEVDHIHPRALGAGDSMNNLALACESCNLYKSDAVIGRDEIEARDAPLYNPRRDDWSEHFWLNSETREMHGRTAVGRATVARLKMNSSFQLRARHEWMLLRIYP